MENREGSWFNFKIDGTEQVIHLKIRPAEINWRFFLSTLSSLIRPPSLSPRALHPLFFKFNLNEAQNIIDTILEDFSGLLDQNDQAIRVTKENKWALISFPLESSGQSLLDFIFEKCKMLSVSKIEKR